MTLGTESLTSRMSLGLGWGSLQKMDVTSLTIQVELFIFCFNMRLNYCE